MSDGKMTVMLVDDVEDNRIMLEQVLEDDYDLLHADSGEQCLSKVEQGEVDLILLDVSMPEMDGYQVCNKLKENPGTAMIPIIFVSAHDSVEERLKGYEAGGDEYLTKPIDEEVLCQKVKCTLQEKLLHKDLQSQATSAMGTALEAMTNSSELGILIRFMESSSDCTTFDALAQRLIDTAQEFGLIICLIIRHGGEQEYYGCEPGSLEAKVLQKFDHSTKVFDFGCRTLIDNKYIVILVKNMPLDEPAKYGRLKDHLVVLSNSAESRAKGIELELSINDRRDAALEQVIVKCEAGLERIEKKINEHDLQVKEVMLTMLDNLEDRLLFLGLEEDQEKSLIELAQQASLKLESLGGFTAEVHQSLHQVIAGLYDMANLKEDPK